MRAGTGRYSQVLHSLGTTHKPLAGPVFADALPMDPRTKIRADTVRPSEIRRLSRRRSDVTASASRDLSTSPGVLLRLGER